MQLYNSMTRQKEEFIPQTSGEISLYVCGITAYDYCHIGHARAAVVFDVLVRYFRDQNFAVHFVRNFTDVDDKIIKRAAEEHLEADEVAQKYIAAYYEDMERLGVQPANFEPKATEHIQDMIGLAENLIAKGHAYATASGDVYFRVRSLPSYGSLSGRELDTMRAGARIAPGEEKEDPLDFALWKRAKPEEPSWPSPWGNGRPGWHLECSAMSERFLGLPLDIHGGGQDLAFPHHENERAQSLAASGKELARFWVHNGFVQVEAEKMSKSLGNFITIRDILSYYLPEVLRYFLVTKHYRSPLDFNWEVMDEAEKGLRRLYQTRQHIAEALSRSNWSKTELPSELSAEIDDLDAKWRQNMEDDLNTAGALGHVFTLNRLANRILEDKTWRKAEAGGKLLERIQSIFEHIGNVLGLFQQTPDAFLDDLRTQKAKRKGIDTSAVAQLITKRQEARRAKDFTTADSVRQQLEEMGIEVQDTPQGPVWDIL
ncbi:cysteine--tRNA ligase [Desulfohalobium retbaense]|uniref:Cysteine--tRNA ligase n=1 Tax=Desulfohalobium retbaense (strain ATCC 49708 / DSM 5692 / JCM 16813 / HR100) TaxID=485915 RepID=C8WYR8_DESRD|nr:cysteine--tRNA ligase [Desulfohalobium retbaense]ACV67834.1 cysteinyl-tRNA synthetase [Desulfohalobium retbaense DSM 5692]